MLTTEGFDAYVEAWSREHPGEAVPAPELFAQYLADVTGGAIVGSPVGEAPAVVAIPDDPPALIK